MSVYVYQPGTEYEYEVSDFRLGGTPRIPATRLTMDGFFPMIDRYRPVHPQGSGPEEIHSEEGIGRTPSNKKLDDLISRIIRAPRLWNPVRRLARRSPTSKQPVASASPNGATSGGSSIPKAASSGPTASSASHGPSGYTPNHRNVITSSPTCPIETRPWPPFYGRSTWAIRGLYERGTETYNFSGANLLRKYGPDWPKLSSNVDHRRFRSWGLNTMANCSQPAIYLERKTPYTATVYSLDSPPEDTPGGTGYVATIHDDGRVIEAASGGWGPFPDVFDPSFKQILRKEVAQHKDKAVGDPWCLGYFLGNELHWGKGDTGHALAVLKSPPDQPAKQVFVADLKQKYKEIEQLNQKWGTDHASWDALLRSTTPPDAERARDDLAAFLDKTADAYFRQCREAVKEVDPDGLYLGCRFAGWANTRTFLAAARYSDVVSVNRYSETITDLRLPGDVDKPVVIGEFHFGALDRGKFHASLRPVADQNARGAAYEKYVRSALENPLVVGTHWHQFGDQATTGRDDGENFQNGFVDVCDTPYQETIDACRRIGYQLYETRAGQ